MMSEVNSCKMLKVKNAHFSLQGMVAFHGER